MEADTIEELKQKYPDEWIIVEVLEEDRKGNILSVRLLEHSRDKSRIDRISEDFEGYTYSFFNGSIPKEGHVFAF